ncbi:MAG: hypothetical protein ACREH4_16465 [Vitreimonas sp.]
MTREEMLQDLAYARTLAEEGRHAPLLGGAHLLFWGVLNALAFTGQWSILSGRLPHMEGAAFAVLWMSYGLVAAIGMTILRMRVRTKPGVTTIGARAERAVWAGAGLAVLAVAAGSIARMILDSDWTAPNAIMGGAFALYGAALIATAMMSEQHWLNAFGWLAVLVAGVLCLFANQPWVYLIAAAGSLLTLAAPGIILLRREPSAVV